VIPPFGNIIIVYHFRVRREVHHAIALSRRLRLHIVPVLILGLLLAPAARAAAPEDVDRAIEKAKQYLYSSKRKAGIGKRMTSA